MIPIGGYFELELKNEIEVHDHALRLNSGRNALEYILRVRNYKKVYIPYFTCEVLLEPFNKLNVDYKFYHIDENLEPIFDYNQLNPKDGFLCTNYFGLKDAFINSISKRVPNLIIDNAQSFFSKPISKIDTFYTPRKFVGVCDGAYLYCDVVLTTSLEQDTSYSRMAHLLMRADGFVDQGYVEFKINDNSLDNRPLKTMSSLTRKILSSIDYNLIKMKRIRNYEYLRTYLKDLNLLKINREENQVPQTYPFWTKDKAIREKLINEKIYCATYWPNVLKWCEYDSQEFQFTSEIIHLPIDQRYDIDDMKVIIKTIS